MHKDRVGTPRPSGARRTARAVGLALVCAAAAVRPSAPRAHGRAPALVSVLPGGAAHGGVLLGTSFGLLAQRAPGAPWQWLCEEAIGYRPEIAPQLAWLPDGILVSTFDGVSIS